MIVLDSQFTFQVRRGFVFFFFDKAICFSLRNTLENSLSSWGNNIFLPRALQVNFNVLGSQKYNS